MVSSAGKMSGLWSGQPNTVRLDELDVICAVLGCGVDSAAGWKSCCCPNLRPCRSPSRKAMSSPLPLPRPARSLPRPARRCARLPTGPGSSARPTAGHRRPSGAPWTA
ncbi:MAG: helix-turn-helix domain-containing protein [Streptosporangiaceae bacterium]